MNQDALLDLNNHVIQCSYQSSKNICSLCDKTFNTIDPTRIRILWIKHLETDHMIHFSKVHEEEKPLSNPALPNSFTKNAKSNNSNNILAKTKNQASQEVFNLLIKDKNVGLKKVTSGRVSLNIHEMPRCKICDMTCISDYSLKSHMTSFHEGEKQKKQKSIVVSNDNLDLDKIKIYKAKENLHHENTIQKSVHDKEKHQIRCNFDAQIIKVKPDLNQSVVSEEKQLNNDNLGGEMISNLNLKCKKCQRVFHSDESLSRHIHNVNGDCYDQPQNTNSDEKRPTSAAKLSSYCEICKKDLSSKSNLTKHIEVVHEGIMPYQCKVCNEDFSQKAKLQIHFRHHHPNTPLPEIRMKFSCSKCSNSFSTEIKLKEHEKKHDSNISCDICNKPFTTTKAVKRHKNSCHPELECLHCHSLFDDVALLKSHVTEVHEGKKLL